MGYRIVGNRRLHLQSVNGLVTIATTHQCI